jgi:hypothetical protein
LVGHLLIVDQDVGAFELRGQDLEQHVAPLELLVRVGRLLFGWRQQTEVRVLQRQLQERLVVVREFQIDFLVILLPLLALLLHEHPQREGQADGRDQIADRLECDQEGQAVVSHAST